MRRMRSIPAFTVACVAAGVIATLPGACGPAHYSSKAVTLHVMAAASLEGAFREIAHAFEQSTGHGSARVEAESSGLTGNANEPGQVQETREQRRVAVSLSVAGSQQLVTQLEHGAPADVFATAGWEPMDTALRAKLVDEASIRVFAHNDLAIIVPRANPAKIDGLIDLARPGVSIVVAERAVPVGAYMRAMLETARTNANFGPGFVEVFETNIISYEQSVSGVVAKVALGEADAGIAYSSDAHAGNAAKITVLPLPQRLAPRADYPVAVTASAQEPEIARAFVEFLASSEAQRILTAHGFSPADVRDVSEEP